MKLTPQIICDLIQEEIGSLLSEETTQEQEQGAVTTISGMLIRLDADGFNADEILNQAEQEYRRNKDSIRNEHQLPPTSERKLTTAEEYKKEEIAKAMEEEDPDIDMSKKMAIATAQAKKSA
jgi:hypothetical protein